MKKKLASWLFPITLILITLHSCSSEDDYFKSQDEKYTFNKFQVFSAQDGKIINYADGFKTLMERYDSLYTVSHTAKTMKRSFSKSEIVSSEYIEFNIRSQEFTTEVGEKYVLFPLIRNYQVDGIMVASLREDETIVEYYEMTTDERNYHEILNLFKAQYLKSNLKIKSKSTCGFDGYPACDIDTVIITVPKGGNGNGLPSGGSGGTSGGCSIYENCIDGNLDGGGGGGVPELTLSDCLKAKLANNNAKDLLNKDKIKIAKEQMTASHSTDVNEKAFSFGTNSSGDYVATDIKTSHNGSNVGWVATSGSVNILGAAHTHISGMYNSFSPGDLYAFQGSNHYNPNFIYLLVYGPDGMVFLLSITDPEKFADFVANYPAGSFLDMETGGWIRGSSLFDSFDSAYQQFVDTGLSVDESYANATAHVLNKYDIGATLSEQNITGDFNSIFVNETVSPSTSGGSSSKSTYAKTPDCNL
ncbi:hypothetical protein [Chryseobacterium sp. CT-SW4]|uniref:hypothetical protein n=1 Tax=Chryseobacterium sp. SW-1 TaxID=3157343 RepID=UPI003B01A6AC